MRTSLAAGAQGVVIPERRAAGLTETVARASAGALAHLPVARVTNLSRAMEEMKEAGYWLVGLDERAEQRHTEVDFKVPVGIVLGGEGKGLHALDARALRFSGFDPDDRPRARAQCFGRRRRRAVRGRPPARPGGPAGEDASS